MTEIVLIEDDDDDIYFFKTACLKLDSSINLITLRNGIEFIDYVKKEGIADKIFFVDLNMPKMGGIEALEKLKQLSISAQMISIIYTTSSREKDILDAYEFGAKSYLLKPDSLTKIQELIQSTINYWFKQNVHVVKGII